ncbi:MAG: rhamnan synthesis F family protein [Alphaproteobacteria bacterium]
MNNTLCLFAGYDKDGIIDDYVLCSVKRFSEISDVYYLSDCEMKDAEIQRLAPFVKKAFAYRHQKYDFGSWSELIKLIGWDTICKYKNLMLVNDSVYGPFYNIKKIITDFEKSCYDFYGFTPNPKKHSYHIQSYFLIFKNNILRNKNFQNFFNNIEFLSDKGEIIKRYEKGLSNLLYKEGFKSDTFIKNYDCYFPNQIVKQNGFFIKVSLFTQKMSKEDMTYFFDNFKSKYTNYDVNLILNHLKRKNVNLDDVIKDSVLKIRNYKTLKGIRNTFANYPHFTYYPLYVLLNFYTFIYHLILRRFIAKPYKSIKKHLFKKY